MRGLLILAMFAIAAMVFAGRSDASCEYAQGASAVANNAIDSSGGLFAERDESEAIGFSFLTTENDLQFTNVAGFGGGLHRVHSLDADAVACRPLRWLLHFRHSHRQRHAANSCGC